MLWTDKLWLTSSDLNSIDGESLDVAASEGLTLDGSNGICQRSLEESGRALLRSLMGFAGFLAGDSLTSNHLQAVFNIGTPAVQRPRVLLDNIVVSGQNPNFWSDLKNWAACSGLVYLFRAASNRNSNDRYATKRDAYAKQVMWQILPQLKELGIPVVYRPMACPAAYQAHNAGTFAITTPAGSSTLPASLDVALSYIDQNYPGAGVGQANNESAPSAITTVSVTSGEIVRIDITNLLPPNGNGASEDVAKCIITPLNATGWNIYAAASGQVLRLQNASPIPIGTKIQALSTLVTNLPAVGQGQFANAALKIQDMLNRG